MDCEGAGIAVMIECAGLGGRDCDGRLERVEGSAVRTLEAERKSSARSVTAENYSGVGSFGETKAINGQPRHEADWATTFTAHSVHPMP